METAGPSDQVHSPAIGTRTGRRALATLVAVALLIAVAVFLFRTAVPAEEHWLIRVDSRFEGLIAADARLEEIARGFRLAEGPVWNRGGAYLLFSDLAANAIYKWQAGAGIEMFLQPSGYSGSEPFKGTAPGANGLAFDRMGKLVLCEHGDRRITRIEPNGHKTILVNAYQGKRLNSPNDLVFDSKGNLYFTDPPFGLPKWFDDPARELPFSGIYRLSVNGSLQLLSVDVPAPNGIAIAPSERTLYVSNSDERQPAWFAYDIEANGSLTRGRIFADVPAWAAGRNGPRDGMKVDRAGNVFASGPGGVHVFAADGAYLGSIRLDRATNLAWGEDGSVLYITATNSIYRLQTLTRGSGF